MRILVADQNALLLAAITATFGPHCDLVTATRRDVCISQVEQHKFDVVIACDKLSDYTGLELLSEIGALSPDTLLIFAANPKRLNQLGKRLAVFGLFEVLSYPITPRKLLDVLKRARQSLRTPSKPKVRHVVLESEWDTGVRLALVEKDLQAEAEATGRAAHDDWPESPQSATIDAAAEPVVEGDDFVFSGPPVVSPASDPVAPARTESRARTFEATPVAQSARGANATDEVIEYEVRPVIPALTHDDGTIACEDEFIFAASQSVSVAASFETAEDIEVEPAGAPVAHESEPSIDDFCSNDAIFDVPEPPRWAEDGAANDTAYEAKPAAYSSAPASPDRRGGAEPASHGSRSSASGGAQTGSGSRHSRGGNADAPAGSHSTRSTGSRASQAASRGSQGSNSARSSQESQAGKAGGKVTQAPSPKAPPQRRARTQWVPTEAQRAAFERAVARRNAALGVATAGPSSAKARRRGAKTEPTIQAASMDSLFAGAPASEQPSTSLSSLARMATTKRPLSAISPNINKNARPKRAVYAVSSGLAAVLILGVLSFELLRNSRDAEHHHMTQGQATSTQLFSSRTMMLDNNQGTGVPQFGPPVQGTTPQGAQPPNQPVAQTFDPSTAPEDPPPPPALEHPGPMEPPSEVHTGPPLGMMPGGDGATEGPSAEWPQTGAGTG